VKCARLVRGHIKFKQINNVGEGGERAGRMLSLATRARTLFMQPGAYLWRSRALPVGGLPVPVQPLPRTCVFGAGAALLQISLRCWAVGGPSCCVPRASLYASLHVAASLPASDRGACNREQGGKTGRADGSAKARPSRSSANTGGLAPALGAGGHAGTQHCWWASSSACARPTARANAVLRQTSRLPRP